MGDKTHKFEYTPGLLATASASGSGSSQRSGRQTAASGPQSAVSRLHPRMSGTTRVPLGSGSAETIVPSRIRIGSESGNTVSLMVLQLSAFRER